MPARIKADDHVIVTSGKDRGKQGRVLRVDPKHERVFVEGLNMIKRHQKANPMSPTAKQTSGVIEKEERDPRLQCGARRSASDGKPTRSWNRRGGRQARARRPPQWNKDRLMAARL